MPLRLVNKQRTHKIEACDTTFEITSMSIGDKEKLVTDLTNVGPEDGAFDRLLDVLCTAIVSIKGYDDKPLIVLKQLEDLSQLRLIVRAVINFCSLTEDEAKNLPSSSEQVTPESAGSAAKTA